MNLRSDFLELVKDIKENNSLEYQITAREFLKYFGYEKRTKGNKARIDDYLDNNDLKTEPSYKSNWIDGEITLRHKAKAKSKATSDPILRINILPSANKPPITINRNSKLPEATTLMMMHDFSQLPVMSNPRSIEGFINWKTIGSGITNGNKSDDVKDYLDTNVTVLDLDTPLLEAIQIITKEEVILVHKNDKTLSGIVTIQDISEQFFTLTEPFLLIEKIENLIRLLLDDRFLVEEIKDLCDEEYRDKIEFIDDLTFGQYIRLIQKESNWEKLELAVDRVPFIKQLDRIREIRNDIMHFDPEGISKTQRDDLNNMANFLTELIKYKKLQVT